MAGGYSSDAQKTADILDLTTQTISWGGNLNKIPTQPYLAGPIRRSRYPIWPYGPIFVPYIYSTFEDVLYSFKFAKWWIRGYIFWFIPGSPWHHWCGQQGGDSQHHWFSGCIGARLVEIYIVISTIEYHFMTSAVVLTVAVVQRPEKTIGHAKAQGSWNMILKCFKNLCLPHSSQLKMSKMTVMSWPAKSISISGQVYFPR